MEVTAVGGLPEVRPGDDLAGLLAEQCDLTATDVLCVASTVVSKAEGRLAELSAYEPGERARSIADRIGDLADDEKDPRFAQAVIEESAELLIEVPIMLAVLPFGHVTVNAGIDRSNVPDADLLLLPEDPTASAQALREGLAAHVDTATVTPDGGPDGPTPDDADVPAVIVTDTSGRPFRKGQRGVALGWAGIPAARDWRGERDRDGRELSATVQAVVDELAAAGNLVTGEGADGTPAAAIADFEFGHHAGSDELYRDREEDLIRDALEEWSHVRD
jgi:coenzyme F420-0:L-glutamate ligase/coenzyme F420-1:gamma-L-glutamate ligase